MSISEKAKVFMFVCIGLAALSVGINQNVSPAKAQFGIDPVVSAQLINTNYSETQIVLVTANGEVYRSVLQHEAIAPGSWYHVGSLFNGSVNSLQENLGGVKGMFR